MALGTLTSCQKIFTSAPGYRGMLVNAGEKTLAAPAGEQCRSWPPVAVKAKSTLSVSQELSYPLDPLSGFFSSLGSLTLSTLLLRGLEVGGDHP